jgi:hypothetical protein
MRLRPLALLLPLVALVHCSSPTLDGPSPVVGVDIVSIPAPAVAILVDAGAPPGDEPRGAKMARRIRSPSDDDDVRESVFRHQLGHNAAGEKSPPVVCFEVDGGDPAPELLRRFADVDAVVRAVSACSSSGQGVFDMTTAQQGLLFRVGPLHWNDDGSATVGGGYYAGSLSASGNTYTVERKDGRWKVVKDVMRWIS